MKKTKKIASLEPNSFTAGKQFAWSLRTFSSIACAMVIGYVTFYGTNILGISAGTVGLLLLVSKIFDAITDVLAGFMVDRTNTKWGKARPYELTIIGLWASTVLMYSCPNLGYTGKCIWLFTWYTLVNDVFFTILNADEPVYMMRAIPNRQDMEKTASLNGFFTIISVVVVSVAYPLMMEALGDTAQGWTMMALIFAVPMTLIGLLRVFFVPEVLTEDVGKKEKISLEDVKTSMTSNHYIWLYLLLVLGANLISQIMNAGTYYFTYIVGDVGLMSLAALPAAVTPVFLIFFPKMLKKNTMVKLCIIGSIVGIVGSVIRQIAGANVGLIVLGTFFLSAGVLPITTFLYVLLADIVAYNEWKTKSRVEGIYASVGSFGAKIGIGLASVLSGLLLQVSGFISDNAAAQPDSALSMIKFMYGLLPAILFGIVIVILAFIDVEKKMKKIRAEA